MKQGETADDDRGSNTMELNRRAFLGGSLGFGAALTLGACGVDTAEDGTAAQTPKAGGTLRIGALGQASGVVSDPFGLLGNDSDMLIMSLVYDPLTIPGRSQSVMPRLATSWSADRAQQNWIFEIAQSAMFHDGSPVRPEDVVWSLRTLGARTAWKVPVELDSIRVAGPNAIAMRTPTPNSQLPLLARLMTFTVKDGTTDRAAFNGSGPYRVETGSYRDGNVELVRNDQWYRDPPLLDRIVVSRFDSPDALTNAVLGDQIDLASNVGALAARTASAVPGLTVVRRPDDLSMPVAIRTSDGPFVDPRVRAAIRLGVDRPAMVEQVLSGYGTVGNDVLGTGDPTYTALEQRSRDIAQAKQLLVDARFDTAVRYPLLTKREVFNEVESAELFAAQMQEIGLGIDVVVKDTADFYDNYWATPAAPLSTVSWATNDSVMFFASKVMNSQSSSNETGFRDPEFDATYRAALAAPAGSAEYREASSEMQRIQHDRGGYVLWGMADGIDVAHSRVQGLPDIGGWGRAQLEKTWLDS